RIVGCWSHILPAESVCGRRVAFFSESTDCCPSRPGIFQTNGYGDSTNPGWQLRPGMKIVGSGVDVTILQLAGNATNAHYYAIGHAVASGGQSNSVDLCEISDFTVDCNLKG